MSKLFEASVLLSAWLAVTMGTASSPLQKPSALLACAGMKLSQSAAPDDGAPDANAEAPQPQNPDDNGSGDDSAQPPGDEDQGDEGGANSDQASPPDSAQPPGCIFRNGPLELLV
jgi:hypothetical protein